MIESTLAATAAAPVEDSNLECLQAIIIVRILMQIINF